ncbi:hypothetical protein CROQUDRAFT_719953 [Cronartium quercuum f. sp. fusiforme G11]|uniref:PUA domain-containing protein n=1 Tax=Cronartium quercuum f. sp. fusiforme G11 TaxID=708437 RepID=A0A9P6TG83_9BASI|nr:hypothetical protein CROQUDRAFT_719953 [Cronartium quercuum f. sp. fusiforme G11]
MNQLKSPTLSSPKANASHATIVIKLGTSSILSELNLQPRLGLLANLVETCVSLRNDGHKIILVSSGAIGMGMRRMSVLEGGLKGKWAKKPKALNEKQALAAIGQGHLIALWDSLFSRLNQPISQILLTRGDLADRSRYLNASSTISTLLNSGVIPIINENDTLSIAEIKFGDNDTLSAVTAGMCKADYLFLMTDVDCLYTENPRKNPLAQMVKVVYDIDGIRQLVSTATLGSSLGTGGMETKLIAAELAIVAGVSTIICNGLKPQSIGPIITHIQQNRINWLSLAETPSNPPALLSSAPSVTDQEQSPTYTVFLPRPTPLTDRKFWVAHGLTPKGSVVIDKGAFNAISRDSNGGRLLPRGLVSVSGTFAVGQAVSIMIPVSYLDPSTFEGRDQGTSGEGHSSKVALSSPDLPAVDTTEPVEFMEVGRGLANYNSHEMDKVKGLHSTEISMILGHIDSEHVIECIVMKRFKPLTKSPPATAQT